MKLVAAIIGALLLLGGIAIPGIGGGILRWFGLAVLCVVGTMFFNSLFREDKKK